MKKIISIMLFIFILTGCNFYNAAIMNQPFTTHEDFDKFTGQKTLQGTPLGFKPLTGWGRGGDWYLLYVSPIYYFDTNAKYWTYSMIFHYEARNWMFMDSVTFLIDGKAYNYKRSVPERTTVIDADEVSEFASFEIPEQLFKNLETARSLSVRISGTLAYRDMEISPGVVNNLFDFYKATKSYSVEQNKLPQPPDAIIPKDSTTEKLKLGIVMVKTNLAAANILHMKEPKGVIIINVVKDSIAFRAGLKQGDIILKYGDKTINESPELQAAIAETAPGSSIPITIWQVNQIGGVLHYGEMVITVHF